MSVEAILQELAHNAGRARLSGRAIVGNAIADVAQIPGAILNDRERRRIQQLQEARQAEQLGFQRHADERAGADQAAQDAAVQLEARKRAALKLGVAAGFGDSDDPTKFDVAKAAKAVTAAGFPELATTLSQFHDQLLPKLTSGTPGSVMRGPDGKVIEGSAIPEKKPDYTIHDQRFSGDGTPIGGPVPAPATHSPIYKEWQDYQASGGTLSFDAYMTADANRKKPVVNVSGLSGLYNDIDPKAIAAQIRTGGHPPDISQYGRPAAAAIASELAKKGPNGEKPFNLAYAQREWNAQKRLNATMNGGQQVRLDESIRSGLAMYDKIDELAKQWDGLGIGPLSRVNLAAAREGIRGPKAATLANQLTGQIGQLTSDVATIEQGGLTPTNESRAIAEKSMQDWWGKGTILDMTAQGRYNMQIRHTARNTQEPMAPGNGVDTRLAQPATPPAAAGPKEGDTKPIDGFPGTEQTFKNGKWIRTK